LADEFAVLPEEVEALIPRHRHGFIVQDVAEFLGLIVGAVDVGDWAAERAVVYEYHANHIQPLGKCAGACPMVRKDV